MALHHGIEEAQPPAVESQHVNIQVKEPLNDLEVATQRLVQSSATAVAFSLDVATHLM